MKGSPSSVMAAWDITDVIVLVYIVDVVKHNSYFTCSSQFS